MIMVRDVGGIGFEERVAARNRIGVEREKAREIEEKIGTNNRNKSFK